MSCAASRRHPATEGSAQRQWPRGRREAMWRSETTAYFARVPKMSNSPAPLGHTVSARAGRQTTCTTAPSTPANFRMTRTLRLWARNWCRAVVNTSRVRDVPPIRRAGELPLPSNGLWHSAGDPTERARTMSTREAWTGAKRASTLLSVGVPAALCNCSTDRQAGDTLESRVDRERRRWRCACWRAHARTVGVAARYSCPGRTGWRSGCASGAPRRRGRRSDAERRNPYALHARPRACRRGRVGCSEEHPWTRRTATRRRSHGSASTTPWTGRSKARHRLREHRPGTLPTVVSELERLRVILEALSGNVELGPADRELEPGPEALRGVHVGVVADAIARAVVDALVAVSRFPAARAGARPARPFSALPLRHGRPYLRPVRPRGGGSEAVPAPLGVPKKSAVTTGGPGRGKRGLDPLSSNFKPASTPPRSRCQPALPAALCRP